MKKKRKKKRAPSGEQQPGHMNEGLAADLHDIEEDVIDAGANVITDDEEEEEEIHRKSQAKTLQSRPADQLFIENKSEFLRKEIYFIHPIESH